MLRRPLAAALAGLLAAGGAGCATDSGTDGSLELVAAFYPLQFVAERVGGPDVSVTGLAPPGVEAHDLELTPSQVARISRADLVVYLAGFQPAVDDAVAEHAAGANFDVAAGPHPAAGHGEETGEEHDEEHDEQTGAEPGHADPGHDHDEDLHIWLDPERLAGIGERLAAELGRLDPAHAVAYTRNARQLRQELATLDQQYAAGLADCQRREIVVSHAAFGHLADRYDLAQVAITGLSPEAEPGPQRLAEVIDQARTHEATTIYFETLVDPAVADVIATHVGATTAVLDPIEGLPPGGGGDYFSLMRANLDALRTGLGCT
jgi:zinc transport system substrate-binding protein